MNLENKWQWTICGKHPVVSDYFQSGSDSFLLTAFSDWMDKGYQLLKNRRINPTRLVSWRFWAQGVKKNMIVCGVVKDSSDRIGRYYPILFAGTGILEDWKNHWDLLPFALEKTWAQMDYLCSKRYSNFKHLEINLHTIKPPDPFWHEFAQKRRELAGNIDSMDGPFGGDITKYGKQLSELSQNKSLCVIINQGLFPSVLAPLELWHALMKKTLGAVPSSVLIGGAGELTSLAVFMRALNPDDFASLWLDMAQINKS